MVLAWAPTCQFLHGHVENNILENNPHLKPNLYCRYVDGIFIVIVSLEQLMLLKQTFNNSSVLQFKHKISNTNKLNFLDVNIEIADDTFHTSVYSKPTNPIHQRQQ